MEMNKDNSDVTTAAHNETVTVKVSDKRGLCLRRSPSLNASVLEVLPCGTKLHADAAALYEPWLAVTTEAGEAGFVAAAFVKKVEG